MASRHILRESMWSCALAAWSTCCAHLQSTLPAGGGVSCGLLDRNNTLHPWTSVNQGYNPYLIADEVVKGVVVAQLDGIPEVAIRDAGQMIGPESSSFGGNDQLGLDEPAVIMPPGPEVR